MIVAVVRAKLTKYEKHNAQDLAKELAKKDASAYANGDKGAVPYGRTFIDFRIERASHFLINIIVKCKKKKG